MISGVRREEMRGTNSQHTEFPEFIRTGNLEDVKSCFLTNGKLDKLLLKTKFGQYEETALHLAVKYRREDIVKWLLPELTAEINATDHYLCTVLHTATDNTEDVPSCAASASDTTPDENKDNNIIELILSCEGVHVNARDTYGNTPVKLAAERGKTDAVRLLLKKAADISLADNADNTTLHVAAKRGHKEVLELLLKTLEANDNTGIIGKQNTDKDTPLHLAASSKCPQCVALLLNAGAVSTVEVKNELGLTAADLAKEQGNEEIIKLLKNPKRAKELLQEKTKSGNSIPLPGRGMSVESDSSANNFGALLKNSSVKVIVHQQFNTNVSGGNVAVGPGAVVNRQDSTSVVPHQSGPPNESNFDVTVTGGNACVGNRPVINVVPGTPGTPSTAGSRDGPFFQGPQENEDTSLGVPTENPNSFGATELSPRPLREESSSDNLIESARRPMQEESPADKVNEAASCPVQGESPAGKVNNEAARRPLQEESPAEKVNDSGRRPMQEESPADKGNKSARRPVQEESPGDKVNKSARRPLQEESPAEKVNDSGRRPMQEESPADKGNKSARRPVQEESPVDKVNESACRPVQEVFLVDKLSESSRRPVQEESPTDELNESSNLQSLSSPVQEECPVQEKATASLPFSVPEQKRDQKNMAGTRYGSSSLVTCAPSPSNSKESPHRKAQHSGEDATPDSTLPTGAATDVNQSIRTVNGETWCPGNHHGDNSVATLQANLGAQSSGDTTAIEIEDENPENDYKSQEQCGCRLM